MSRQKIREALARGPVKVQVGSRIVTLTKIGKIYHIVVIEPGKEPRAWQYASEIAIDRFEKHIDLLRRPS